MAAAANAGAVAVTGCSGRIGLAVTQELARQGHTVVGIDCVERPEFSGTKFVRCDVANVDAVTAAIAGAWAVIHLAAVPDDAPFASALVPANIEGVAAVIAAVKRTTSVKRLLIASSGKIFSGYSGATPIDVDTPPAPTCMYSATKLFAEAAALALANSVLPDRELHVLVPRFGWLPRTQADVDAMTSITGSGEDGVNAYLSPGDAGRFVASFLSAHLDPSPARRHHVVYVQSRPQQGATPRFAVRAAAELLGWAPTEAYPEGVDAVVGDEGYTPNPALFARVLSAHQAADAATAD